MGILTNLKKKIVDFFGNIRIYKGGIVLWGQSAYHINGTDQRRVLSILEPGDIVFRRYSHYLGSLVVPGYWSHCGIYIGENNIIHAAGGGVTLDDILTFMRADSIAVLRCTDVGLTLNAIDYSEEQYLNQVPYDYNFKAENDALYCSEMVWEAFDRPECPRIMEQFILPDDLLYVKEFETIIDIKH